jgi:DNA-binding transcriptional LysR family regulator
MDLDALADFNLVAQHGGLGAASRAARRPKASLSRHVAALERSLGVRLIERGERSLRLTEEGQILHERTHALLSEIADVGQAITGGATTPRGTLRVSVPMVLAHVAMVPIALEYARLHPGVVLEIIAEDRRVDPVEDGYDVVIRIDPSPDDRLVGRRVLTDRRWVVASPATPLPPGTVIPVRGVMMAASVAAPQWRVRAADGRLITLNPEPAMRFSSLLMVRDAVLAGAGVALLPKLLVAEDVATGRLTCWGEADGPPVEIWALHKSRRLASSKLRAFLAVLEAGF